METIILFAPLLGSLIAGFGWRVTTIRGAQWISTGLLFLACAFSWIVFFSHGPETQHIQVMRWIESGTLSTDWSIRLDRLTSIMLIVVTTVSALVHLYSFGYMAHDENFKEGEESYRARFFAYLSFFTFAMLMLVTSDNLVQMFFGWEGVGVASYLLIGFYYRKPSANAAAMKAFIVNRVGDFGFALGIFALYYLTDSVRFDDVFAAVPELAQTQVAFLWAEWNAVELVALLLFIGAMGKSAQLFLHTWLPDAMEGPTPVSALIHAATMVTAGVFLVCRMSPLMEFAPEAKQFITFLGATTAFVAATIGLVQNDIKRVIAYSTMSQLGYMFVAAGVGVYSVAMFHLFTHAFFKAMLFLGAGSVIHAMHHEQDMRHYGGLRRKIPYTFWAMMVGTLAITGVGIPLTHIGFAGFLSKDAVIESAWAGTAGGYAFWMLVVAALFTSFYSWRLMFLTFYGSPRGNKHTHEHAHESPPVMLAPLAVLGLGAVFSGMVWYGSFFGSHEQVNRFFGIPAHAEAEAHGGAEDHGAAEDHAEAADPAPEAQAHAESAAETAAPETEGAAQAGAEAADGAEAPAAGTSARSVDPDQPITLIVRGSAADLPRETETTQLEDQPQAETAGAEESAGADTTVAETAAADSAGADTDAADTVVADSAETEDAPATAEAAPEQAEGEAAGQDEAGTAHAALPPLRPEGAIYMAPENHVMDEAHHAPVWVKVSPFIAMLIGLATAFWFYIVDPSLPRRLAENQRPLHLFLLNKWYFDEAYDFLFLRPAKALGRLFWRRGDGAVIDGTINGIAMGVVPFFTRLAGRAQSGYIFTYAFAMVIGIAVFITWMTMTGGAH